ncbi:ATPase, P-type, phospholipid-translocating, flippase [Metarhizium album ARSEF 1941]|uniref:Phospholipid-transporting ATPase n=1 Tax=Metarhizium album (strain ARSEF 1941) TaxID=1081103 RepID=A0A0B2WN45_METAS|nr:ATPase, P-type, phospholipid-translocating, flippase [Metarhizium album ARSEF 1941]KHN94912.1 ATPase, P-type, phospholipid-translocating, flippase [Metarhizium album ARSEF 1941]
MGPVQPGSGIGAMSANNDLDDDDDDDIHSHDASHSTNATKQAFPRRANSDPANPSGIVRAASFSGPPSNRRLLARSTSPHGDGHGEGHYHQVPPTIPSRNALTDMELSFGDAGQRTPKTAIVSTTTPVDDEATQTLRNSSRRLRPEKTREDRGKKEIRNASWKNALKLILSRTYQKLIIEGALRGKPPPPSHDGRRNPLNPSEALIDGRSQRPYIGNFIRSSRYTAYDFVPKQLLFQFSKLGNFYFLAMGVLQMIPGLSTVGRWTTIVPLSIFVAFSMLKEGYDDYRRYQLDKSENRSETWVLNRRRRHGTTAKDATQTEVRAATGNDSLEGGAHDMNPRDWLCVQWQHVKVGDVVRLRRNDGAPADMILLHATGPNGVAYIETMALDGETNLKSKQACPLLAERCNTLDGIKSTTATIDSEDPNIDLYSYDGRVTAGHETQPLSLNNVIYRGSILRNTAEAIGIVVNSGEECKIRMNANKNVTAKKPAMHTMINKMVLFQIVIVLTLAAGLTVGYSLWKKDTQDWSFYVATPGQWTAGVPLKEVFFGYLIMFNTLIPLSLYISMEIIKIGQLFLLRDVDMYDPVTDTPMVANTTTILENLGQVSHVFSDKTGTLTENIMRFRKMSVAGVAFLHDMDIQRDEHVKQKDMAAAASRSRHNKGKQEQQPPPPVSPHKTKFFHRDEDDILEEDEEEGANRRASQPRRTASLARASRWRSTVRPNEEPEMKTEDMLDYVRRHPNTVFSRKVRHFLLCIALCHTCLPEKQDDGDFSFQAASPDELALVEYARDMGWLLMDRTAQTIKLQTYDDRGVLRVESYQVLDVVEFSSKRKRMSIIIRMPNGRICVFCKGADNVITSRLRLSHLAEQKASDVSRRASMRKTFEQGKVRTRMSMASGRGTPRTSLALKRGESIDRLERLRRSIGRLSMDASRLPCSEGVGSWVARRQADESGTPRVSQDVLSHARRQSLSHMPAVEDVDHRIDESMASNEAAVFEQCFQHVEDFATEGLRTLLHAYRYVDEDAYASWKQLYREAETSLVNRQELVERAGEMIEQKLELAGATATEDKLQDGVPETIDKLRRANIKVWMLTGDKRETAINIGHSARVCKPFSEIYILDGARGNLRDTMTSTLNDVCRGMVPHSVVVVDGHTLATIDASDELAVLFYDLVLRVDSVICCRASPSQKTNLVTSIRRFIPSSMTLAIGDGANDIGMIQSSHVGIGIFGREGLQASRISDYSIAQFRFLQQLLLVHGRWNYLRTGKYVLATFWKEVLFFMVQAHFQRFNGYSGTSLFESWSLTVFNSLFTSLPVILLGIFEKDLGAETLLAVPELYTFGQQNRGFNLRQYFGWMAMGVAGSFVIYYFTLGEFWSALFTADTSLYAMGVVILELHSKTVITFGGFIISVAGWFLWCLFLSGMYPPKVGKDMVRRGLLRNFGRQASWWTTLLVALAALVVMDLVAQGVRRVYWPTDQDLMQRMEKDAGARRALREHAALREAGFEDDDVEMHDLIARRGRGSVVIDDGGGSKAHGECDS